MPKLKRHVLLVEDDPAERQRAQEILENPMWLFVLLKNLMVK